MNEKDMLEFKLIAISSRLECLEEIIKEKVLGGDSSPLQEGFKDIFDKKTKQYLAIRETSG
jgi:hypothetical protein